MSVSLAKPPLHVGRHATDRPRVGVDLYRPNHRAGLPRNKPVRLPGWYR